MTDLDNLMNGLTYNKLGSPIFFILIDMIYFLLRMVKENRYKGKIMEDFTSILVLFAPHALELSSILHVTLLVFLRLLAVRDPLATPERRVKLRHVSIALIWTISLLLPTIFLIATLLDAGSFHKYFNIIYLNCFEIFPVICIVVMYYVLIRTLRKKKNENKDNSMGFKQIIQNSTADGYNKKMQLLVGRLVIVLLFCYVPFLACMNYFNFQIIKGSSTNRTMVVMRI